MVQVALRAGEHHVFYASLQRERERSVVARHFLLIRPVVSDDAYYCILHRLLVFVHHQSLDGDSHGVVFETVDVVVATRVAAVGTEKSIFALPESDSEIIAGGVDWEAHILHFPSQVGRVADSRGTENVETAHPRMSVGREI